MLRASLQTVSVHAKYSSTCNPDMPRDTIRKFCHNLPMQV